MSHNMHPTKIAMTGPGVEENYLDPNAMKTGGWLWDVLMNLELVCTLFCGFILIHPAFMLVMK